MKLPDPSAADRDAPACPGSAYSDTPQAKGEGRSEEDEPIGDRIRDAIFAAIQQDPYGDGTVLETFAPWAVAVVATNAALGVVNPWVENLVRVGAQAVIDEVVRLNIGDAGASTEGQQ